MCQAYGPKVRNIFGVFFFWDQDNQSLVQKVQSLLIQAAELMNNPDYILFDDAPATREEKTNKPIRAWAFSLGASLITF
jgi:hypothetical protein